MALVKQGSTHRSRKRISDQVQEFVSRAGLVLSLEQAHGRVRVRWNRCTEGTTDRRKIYVRCSITTERVSHGRTNELRLGKNEGSEMSQRLKITSPLRGYAQHGRDDIWRLLC